MSFGVEYDLTLPETTPLDLRNRFGRVDVTRLGGPANINNGNGTVIFTGGRGHHRIENSFGDVEVRGNDGDVTVMNGNGTVTASDITGTVDVTNRFGGVRVTNAGRGLTVRSNNGNIEATNIGGAAYHQQHVRRSARFRGEGRRHGAQPERRGGCDRRRRRRHPRDLPSTASAFRGSARA